MKPQFITLVFVAICLQAATVFSQQKRSISLDDAVRLGMEHSKLVHSSQMKVQAAEAKVQESASSMLPTLSVSGGYTRLSPVTQPQISFFDVTKVSPDVFQDPTVVKVFTAIGQAMGSGTSSGGESGGSSSLFPIILDNMLVKATIAYPVYTGGRLEASKNAAEFNAQAAQQDLVKDKIEMAYNIQNTYWTLFKLQQLRKVTEETVQQAEAHLKDVQNMFKNGMMTSNDVLKLQVQLSNAKLAHLDANNNTRLMMVNLNNMLGLPLTTELELTSSVDFKPGTQMDWEAAVQKALSNRPDLTATELRTKAAQEIVRAADGGYLPQVSVGANYTMANPNQRILPMVAEFRGTWDIGVQFSWTLWNWGATGHQKAQAEAQVAQAQDALEMLKDGIKVEITQNYLSLVQSKEKVAVSQQSLEQANENYRITNEKFKKGMALTSDLTDAETAQTLAKINQISAIVDFEVAQSRLIKSLGTQSQNVSVGK